jgi:hypothetical protein
VRRSTPILKRLIVILMKFNGGTINLMEGMAMIHSESK